MKKERNITLTLTLEKAKEWYKKDGELKEVALQAFNEEELNPNIKYIDLGLPSGTLWADTNEEDYYSYQEAIDTYSKNNLPKLTDFAELYDYCKWEWCEEKKGMIVTGSNSNSIFFPAFGCRYPIDDTVYGINDVGLYWSATPHSDSKAYCLRFYNNSEICMGTSHRSGMVPIRKIKKNGKFRKATLEEE